MKPQLSGTLGASPEEVLRTLRTIYQDLPQALRTGNQVLSTLTLPFSVADWTVEEPGFESHLTANPPQPRPPTLRRDFYTGEVFVERQSNFTLRAQDLGDFTGLRCIECENFVLDLNGLPVVEQPETRQKFLLHFYACADFTIRQIGASGGRNFALFEDCDRFLVSDIDCRDYEGYGLILLHSRFFRVQDCRFTDNLASGIMILGDCREATVADCRFTGSRGYYNWDAGLHICHCSRRIAAAQVPELCHEPLPIRQKTMRPTRIRIQRCLSDRNRAQGVYVEGARECLMVDNTLSNNNKEGICLDWGTSLCVLSGNRIISNGYRSRMTETEIGIDFVEDFPLLPDQSSTCKLPGVSFDNGVLNAIVGNSIADNFGGGIKLVRSALANFIGGNSFGDNARGTNFFVKKLYDIYILSLGNRGGEFDNEKTSLLDFYGSSFNWINNNNFSSREFDTIHQGNEFNAVRDNRYNVRGNDTGQLIEKLIDNSGSAVIGGHPYITNELQERPTLISEHTLYSFGGVTERHHAVIRLRPDGMIEFSPHRNESHWRIDGRHLLFFDEVFNVTTRFEVFSHPTEHSAFIGRFRNSAILHYLIPLIRTNSLSSASQALPPLFINAISRGQTSWLGRFFDGLGWVSTGLYCGPHGALQSSSADEPMHPRPMLKEELLFPFPKVVSIIPPGQSFIGTLPWQAEYQQCCGSLFCVFGCRNLRQVLVSRCVHQEQEARSTEPDTATWYSIADPRDRFLAFLDLFSAESRSLAEYAPWLESDRALIVRIEDLLEKTLTPSLNDRLITLGLPGSVVQSALDGLSAVDSSAHQQDEPHWERYWSEHAERYFGACGLRAMNETMGYER